jgi:hypothetical protein
LRQTIARSTNEKLRIFQALGQVLLDATIDDTAVRGEHLLALHDDATAYEAYLAWKQRPLPPTFVQFLAEQTEHPFVRLCHRVRSRQVPATNAP